MIIFELYIYCLQQQQQGVDSSRGQTLSIKLQLSGKQQIRASLELQIIDINDNAPKFDIIPTVYVSEVSDCMFISIK